MSLLADKKAQYPAHYQNNRIEKYQSEIGLRVHDCIGLIKGYLWSLTASDIPKYNKSQDVSANGMLSVCKEKGKIATLPEIPGVLVFMSGHVGVYIGGGEVIEARGFNYGVVKTKLAKRPWTHWGKCPWITYPAQTDFKKSIKEVAADIIAGKYGVGHTNRKKKLEAEGCPYPYKNIRAEVNRQLEEKKAAENASKAVYFPKYNGESNSIIDALKSLGIDSSKAYRRKIAAVNGIKNYAFLPSQNEQLLNKLKAGRLMKP